MDVEESQASTQSTPVWANGESRQLTVIRLSGSFSSIRLNRSRAEPLISSGISKTPILTFCSNDRILSSSNGRRPVRSAKRMIPHDQISDDDPWYALPYTESADEGL